MVVIVVMMVGEVMMVMGGKMGRNVGGNMSRNVGRDMSRNMSRNMGRNVVGMMGFYYVYNVIVYARHQLGGINILLPVHRISYLLTLSIRFVQSRRNCNLVFYPFGPIVQ